MSEQSGHGSFGSSLRDLPRLRIGRRGAVARATISQQLATLPRGGGR